jgi:5-methylthioadenosine/S-adenosylhomocysteine deaminase
MEGCDLLLVASWVLPMVPSGTVLKDHAVAIRNGRIVALLPEAEANARFAPRSRELLHEQVLLPGLINAHCHAAMTVMRGLADDLPLMTWLQEHIWPAEAKWVGAGMVRDGARLAAAEMFLRGVTCVNDMYFFPDVSAQSLQKIGMRAVVGLPVLEFPTAWAGNAAHYLDRAEQVFNEFSAESRLRFALAPHAPYTVSDESFLRVRTLSDQLQLPVHVHVHETAFEVDDAFAKNGERPFSRLQRLGLVNEKLIAVHMTQLTQREIDACAQFGVSVVHCPESNLKLASGFCPVDALMKAGARVVLGTDGCASNNDLDVFGEMRTAAMLAKAVAKNAAAFPAHAALEAATIRAAEALGWAEDIGSIEPGKAADLISVDLSRFTQQPVFQPASQLVYTDAGSRVKNVWVEGEYRVRDGELIADDLAVLNGLAQHWGERIRVGQAA